MGHPPFHCQDPACPGYPAGHDHHATCDTIAVVGRPRTVDRQRILRLAGRGLLPSAIASQTGVCEQTIRAVLTAAGWAPRWAPADLVIDLAGVTRRS